jgi:AbiV family abortive infection protein
MANQKTNRAIRDPFGLLQPEQKQLADALMERYSGFLSLEQLAAGIQVCLRNIRELKADADLLFESGRWARSMSMLIIAMEEIGKISILCAMARIPSNNQSLWTDAWASFRSHEDKSTWSFVSSFSQDLSAHPELLIKAGIAQRAFAPLCERLRQFGLYTDFHASEKRWLEPAEVTEADAQGWQRRFDAAFATCSGLDKSGLYSTRALELLREVYAEINAKRPRRKDVSWNDVATALDVSTDLAEAYFGRLRAEGFCFKNIGHEESDEVEDSGE